MPTSKVYEPLTGLELINNVFEKAFEELREAARSSPLAKGHLTWPNAQIEVTLRVTSIDNQLPLELSSTIGPITTPDQFRQQAAPARKENEDVRDSEGSDQPAKSGRASRKN